MYASACIYMCCNTKGNIMKNQAGRLDLGSRGKIYVFIIFMFYALAIVYFLWADPPMVLCISLHMVLGDDGFRPLVFFRSGQGNYDYVLIQG